MRPYALHVPTQTYAHEYICIYVYMCTYIKVCWSFYIFGRDKKPSVGIVCISKKYIYKRQTEKKKMFDMTYVFYYRLKDDYINLLWFKKKKNWGHPYVCIYNSVTKMLSTNAFIFLFYIHIYTYTHNVKKSAGQNVKLG